jgi:hypothetical protein
MLQGNPFETELVMRERTSRVQQEVEQRGLSLATEGARKVGRWLRSVVSGLGVPSFNRATCNPLKTDNERLSST